MKIAVIGCAGKVNSLVIEEVLWSSNHELAGVLLRAIPAVNHERFAVFDDVVKLAENADVIIDFTTPETSLDITKKLMFSNTLLVSGTTGFTDSEFELFKSYAKYFPIIWSANMSVGINLLLSMLRDVTEKLGDDFDCGIVDIHHKHKKDAPSGTALLLAKEVAKVKANLPEIASLRVGEEKGEHMVIFSSENESLRLEHKAVNRLSFVKGAIRACEWGQGKPNGFYTMQDVFA